MVLINNIKSGNLIFITKGTIRTLNINTQQDSRFKFLLVQWIDRVPYIHLSNVVHYFGDSFISFFGGE